MFRVKVFLENGHIITFETSFKENAEWFAEVLKDNYATGALKVVIE